jgi:hypothetical protein
MTINPKKRILLAVGVPIVALLISLPAILQTRARAQAPLSVVAVLRRLGTDVPADVDVDKIQLSPDGKITFDGQAQSLDHVQQVALLLQQGRPLQLLVSERLSQDHRGTVTFHIEARFQNPAPRPVSDNRKAGKDAAKGRG